MDMRNAEGYPDPTAYRAIMNILRERKLAVMGIKRGEVYYVESIYDQSASRPAVVVSTDEINDADRYVTVVYLTTNPKIDLNTHVLVRSIGNGSTALCECPASVPQERLGNFKGSITENEMTSIEIGLMIALGLEVQEPQTIIKEVPVYMEAPTTPQTPLLPHVGSEDRQEVSDLKDALSEAENDLLCLETENRVLRSMYNDLLNRVIGKGASV